jgi:hypothetical protein
MSVPEAATLTVKKYRFPSATDANASAETRPTITVSTTPISMMPTWASTMGNARRAVAASSVRPGKRMRERRDGSGATV